MQGRRSTRAPGCLMVLGGTGRGVDRGDERPCTRSRLRLRVRGIGSAHLPRGWKGAQGRTTQGIFGSPQLGLSCACGAWRQWILAAIDTTIGHPSHPTRHNDWLKVFWGSIGAAHAAAYRVRKPSPVRACLQAAARSTGLGLPATPWIEWLPDWTKGAFGGV